uniref:Protein kinase domain-containing protein n=1 Tax=Eptatretus burgeri TaxID=7764 RepID=A0A8C4QZ23_EPTBU
MYMISGLSHLCEVVDERRMYFSRKATMDKSGGSEAVRVNESLPLATSKEKKITLWQRIKNLFRRTKRKGKRNDNVPHGMSAKPKTGTRLGEKVRSGASVKALLSMDNSELMRYLEDHLDVVNEFLHSHSSVVCQYLDGHRGVLNDYVDEYITYHSIKFWLAERKGFHLSDRKYDEGGDIKFQELKQFKDNISIVVVALRNEMPLNEVSKENLKNSIIEMLDDPAISIDERLKTYLRSNPHVMAALMEFTQTPQLLQKLFSQYHEIRKYIACHRSVLSDYVEEYIILQSIDFWLADQRGLLSKTLVTKGSKDNYSEEMQWHRNGEFQEHEQIGNWEVIEKIGQGGLGFIYKAKNVNSSLEVALKKSRYVEGIAELRYGAEIMRKLECPNIVKLIDVIENGMFNEVVLVMEYLSGGSLYHQLVSRKTFSLVDACPVMKQMASAFAYMHSKNVVHRDIKLCNVLCNDQLVVKVIDFGLAKVLNEGEKLFEESGTCGYMAPEISEDGYEGPPADVWSLGILFIQLFLGIKFNGSHLLKKKSDTYTYSKVVPKLPPNSGPELAGLLLGMTYNEPALRFTMEEILHHNWFTACPSSEELSVTYTPPK